MNYGVHELQNLDQLQSASSPYASGQKFAVGGSVGCNYEVGNQPKYPQTWWRQEDESDCTDREDSNDYSSDSSLSDLTVTPTTPSPFRKKPAKQPVALAVLPNFPLLKAPKPAVTKEPVRPKIAKMAEDSKPVARERRKRVESKGERIEVPEVARIVRESRRRVTAKKAEEVALEAVPIVKEPRKRVTSKAEKPKVPEAAPIVKESRKRNSLEYDTE